MLIQYFGHSAFLITLASENTILFDPYRNFEPNWLWFANRFPLVNPDFVVITHPHFDHDEIDTLTNFPTILRDPIQVEGDGFKILAMRDKHAKGYGAEFGAWNNVVVLEADGLRFCHWGDNRPDPSDELFDWLGEIDVLAMPIDDNEHILDFAEVGPLLERVRPKVVLPVHYKIDGFSHEQSSLGKIDRWLATIDLVKQIPRSEIMLERDHLPELTEVWVFEKTFS
ncbi:MAG: MBL fold metallo-hydrolase [Anaerolineae bacterium]